jgi:hypothetical protein
MGLRPTHRNESQDVTPAKAGVHVREELDSRFRGNDVTFDGALTAPSPGTRHLIPLLLPPDSCLLNPESRILNPRA